MEVLVILAIGVFVGYILLNKGRRNGFIDVIKSDGNQANKG